MIQLHGIILGFWKEDRKELNGGKMAIMDTTAMQIKLAFMGAIKNLCLLENKLVEMKNIPMYQYTNYLSQLALCVELGLKSIISNSDEFEHIHDLGALFFKTPNDFQHKVKSEYSEEIFITNISNMKKIVVDFRYLELYSTLNEYFDENMINSNNTINIEEASNQENFQFLRLLLDKIIKYENINGRELIMI